MNSKTIDEDSKYRLTTEELAHWNDNGYFVRYDVFTKEENDVLRQIADDIAVGKIPFPASHINQNALVREGEIEKTGIHAMHKIHHASCYNRDFLARTRDPRLVGPVIDLIGPDIVGLNNLYIWKAPEIGLGFPWHQDRWYFNHSFKTNQTVGTWTAIDDADMNNGCIYVIPGSHKGKIYEHYDLEGPQQGEFKQARGARDEDGVAVEVPAGAVVWFDNGLLHKSTDNQSQRFRRANVAHYMTATAEWARPNVDMSKRPMMWIRGKTYPGKVDQIEHDVIPIPASD